MSESFFSIAAPAATTHAPTPSGWTIQCDFDGTISVEDVTDSLLQRFGGRGWHALEKAWESGQIGSRECMSGQVSLLDMSAHEFDSHLDRMPIDRHFRAFVAAARLRGITVQVVSDGLDLAIKRILQAHDLGDLPVVANQLIQITERGWRLYTPHARANCERASGNCKCANLATQRKVHGKVLFVGDGSSDFCVSGKADFVLAKDRLIGHCRSRRIAHAAFDNFRDALDLMLEITARKDCLA
ncbi:2,3-diketo-5-methylthio-1-phosphopentane phosphatase [Variovorax boronicumulans]|uniref:MtnX-like HAD-IB family phosphatase n=1 Tax=Variovorax boronicumulans TaxID=436515 RepID=UPI00159DBA99|nr:MtnX-like HAD-IB family phosphatase [Variovorax boronicumulans]MDQ0012929.1 2,3-diketo-5-methylthio-1-phosphopentane phosphatase [Variovorax boronicumulans]